MSYHREAAVAPRSSGGGKIEALVHTDTDPFQETLPTVPQKLFVLPLLHVQVLSNAQVSQPLAVFVTTQGERQTSIAGRDFREDLRRVGLGVHADLNEYSIQSKTKTSTRMCGGSRSFSFCLWMIKTSTQDVEVCM